MHAEMENSNLDKEIQKSLKKWEVPGLAIAIIRDNKVIFSKGYGVRKLGEDFPVDEFTLFSIGSLTKSFTSQAMALLIDSGKINWDDPIVKYLPNFYLFNPYVTQETTLRDILAHRTGLGSYEGDLLWFKTNYDRQEILRRIRFLKPSTSFRAKYAYQNVLYLIAAELIQSLAGKSWDDFLKENVFYSIAMKNTIPSLPVPKDGTNIASPHAKIDGHMQPIPWMSVDNIAPAAAIISNLSDMTQWMKFILEGRNSENAALIFSQEILKPQIIIDPDPFLREFFPDSQFLSYGLGLVLHEYYGSKIIQHDGIINGMTNLMVLIPEKKLGIIVLTNAKDNLLPYVLSYKLIDDHLGISPRDWETHFINVANQIKEENLNYERKIQKEHILNSNPTLSLEKYAGVFHNELLGNVTIFLDHEGLEATLIAEKGKLKHWQYDTFRFYPDDPQLLKTLITFTLNSQDEVESLKIPEITDECFNKCSY